METLALALGYAVSGQAPADACDLTEIHRIDPQHISQPIAALLSHYGLSDRDEPSAEELPALEMSTIDCDACLST
jgi:hypothetical protein